MIVTQAQESQIMPTASPEKVTLTPAQCHEIMARIQRHVSYSPDDGMLSAEQDLWAACNTIISQVQSITILNKLLDDLEQEITTMRNQMTAVEDDLAETKRHLRELVGVGP